MTDLTITAVGDATLWFTQPALNDAAGKWVRVKSGEQRGFVWPELDSILGRTVLVATLSGRVGPGHVGQTYTLTPYTARKSPGRVTWNNEPAVNSGAAITKVVSALADGTVVDFDITAMIQAVADGTEWFGVQLKTNSTSTGQRFYATDSGDPAWELQITLSDAPDVPSNLRPSGGAVPINKPTLAWDFVDLGGTSTAQADSWVQVDTPAAGVDPDEVSPDYSSGWKTNASPQWNLNTAASPAYTPPGSPPGPTYWRVNTRDADGNVSGWSDWADYTVVALPTLVVDSPTGTFGDPTPQVTAHLTGGTVGSWMAYATGPDRADVRTPIERGDGAVDWQVPFRNADGRRVLTGTEAGWIYLRVYDTVDRAVAVGQKTYVDDWIAADLVESATPTAPTGLTVTQVATGDPRSVWEWSRTEDADAWLIEVDGKELARLDPADVTVNTGVYTWTDSGEPAPLRPHTLRVRAVEGTDKSTPASYTRTHSVEGVWLLPEGDEPIYLAGAEVSDFAATDNSATYRTLDGREIDIIYGPGMLTGNFSGGVSLETRDADDVWATLDRIDALAAADSRRVRMVWGSRSILAQIRSPHHAPHSSMQTHAHRLRHRAAFGFVQVGE